MGSDLEFKIYPEKVVTPDNDPVFAYTPSGKFLSLSVSLLFVVDKISRKLSLIFGLLYAQTNKSVKWLGLE